MRSLLFGLVFASLVACQSTPKVSDESALSRERKPAPVAESGRGNNVSIDYIGLQRALGMEIPQRTLGYKEKVFNTCEAGYGYSGTQNCHREYMVVINVHLQCRDSEGQVSDGVNNVDLMPIANKTVKWNLKGPRAPRKPTAMGLLKS